MMTRRTKSEHIIWDLFCTPPSSSSSSHNSDVHITPTLRGPLISNSADIQPTHQQTPLLPYRFSLYLSVCLKNPTGYFSKHSDKIKCDPKCLNSRYDPQKDQYTPEQKVQQEIFDKTL